MKPNILLITTDQQRGDTLACAGNPVIETPNLDALAASGILFRRAYSPAPLCVPARTSLLTARAPGRLDSAHPERIDNATRMDDGTPTLPMLLNDAGYDTALVGKMHVWPLDEPYRFRHRVLSEETRFYRLGARFGMKQDRDDYDRFLEARGLIGYDKPPEIGYNEIAPLVSPLRDEHHVTTWCADETIRYLESRNDAERPFFLWSSFVKPHVPYDPPAPWHRKYRPADIPARIRERAGTNPLYEHTVRHSEWWLYSEEAWELSRAYYYGVVSHIDHHLGRVFATLKSLRMWDDTLIVFTSDHGELLGDHGLWFKSLPFEGSMHVPCIVKPPNGTMRGEVRDDLIDLLDVPTTLLAAADIDSPSDAPGADFVSDRDPHEYLIGELGNGASRWVSYIDGRWKFWHFLQGGYEELYDLDADPSETRNVIDTPDGKRMRADFVPKIADWIRRRGNPDGILTHDGELRVEPQHLHDLHDPGMAEGPFSRGIHSVPRVPEAYRRSG